jgi:hypothetical protein
MPYYAAATASRVLHPHGPRHRDKEAGVRHLGMYTCMVGETPRLPRTLRGSFLRLVSSLCEHLGMICMSPAYILQLECPSRRGGRVGDHDGLELLSLV